MKSIFQTVVAILIAQLVVYLVGKFSGKTMASLAVLTEKKIDPKIKKDNPIEGKKENLDKDPERKKRIYRLSMRMAHLAVA